MSFEATSSPEVNSTTSFGHSNIDGGIDWNADPHFYIPAQRMSDTEWYARFPEQARRFCDPESIASIQPLPPQAQVAFEATFGEEIRNGTVKAGLDPFIKRYRVWMKRVSQYGDGVVWEAALTFCGSYDPYDPLPADLESLNTDGRYDHWAGCVGDFIVPTERDFRNLRQIAEIKNYAGKEITDVKVAARLAAPKKAKHAAHFKERLDFWRDFFDYYKTMYRRAWAQQYFGYAVTNGGTFIIKDPDGIIATMEREWEAENWNIEQRDGYFVRTKKHRLPETPKVVFGPDFRKVRIEGELSAEASIPLPDTWDAYPEYVRRAAEREAMLLEGRKQNDRLTIADMLQIAAETTRGNPEFAAADKEAALALRREAQLEAQPQPTERKEERRQNDFATVRQK